MITFGVDHMLLVVTMCLKIGFALAQRRGRRVSAWGAMHMAAALAGCRTALVNTG